MDLRFTPEEQAFRQEVRSFIAANLDKETHASMAAGHRPSKEQIVAWQRILNKKGWATVDWPKEFGGHGLEHHQAPHLPRGGAGVIRRPSRSPSASIWSGPVIITFGTRGAEEEIPAAHRQSRRLVVPGFLRAGLGLGSRFAEDGGAP